MRSFLYRQRSATRCALLCGNIALSSRGGPRVKPSYRFLCQQTSGGEQASNSMIAAKALYAITGGAIGFAVASVFREQKYRNSDPKHHFNADEAKMGHATTVDKSLLRKFGDKNYVYRVALTGGPCGGKSSSLKAFSKELSSRGFDVYRAPEVPTLLMNGGCSYPGIDGGEKLFQFESHLMDLQLQTERSFVGIAQSTERPSVLVMDRGLLDIAAYIPRKEWKEVAALIRVTGFAPDDSDDDKEILNRKGLTEEQLLGRYDMVLHLVTAADGAEKFYTTANNKARRETVEEARALDKKMVGCWGQHPHHHVIDNSTDFKGKLARATSAVISMIERRE